MLPPDWRVRLVEMVRGAEPVRPEWFTGGPVCTPAQQIGIYVRQYELRLHEALRSEALGLCHLLGDDGSLLRRYLAERPSRSWTLDRVADGLADWLAAQGAPPEQVEMAALDRAVQAGFGAADGVPLDPAALATVPRLGLAPHVRLLRPSRNVHDVRSAVLTGGEVPALAEGDFPLVVFRAGLEMRTWPVPLALWRILDEIGRGASIGAAIEAAFARGPVDAATLQDWFREVAEHGLVEVAPTGTGPRTADRS